jgi:CheY-like chemotaxis protein
MKKLLIIEDDQIVANIYRNKFSVEGFQVEIALDGQTGLELMKSFIPDVVVLDLMLPKVTGVEFLRQVRADQQFKDMPVIVFSNTYLSNMVQEAWKAGATKCLSKANCTPRHVIEVVRSTLPAEDTALLTATKPKRVSPAKAAVKTQESTAAADADAEFQAELRRSFIEGLPGTLAALRALLQGLIKSDSEMARLKQLHELYRKIHALTGNAGIAGMMHIAQMADALEALLKELYEKPKNINASTLRTVALAVDFLAALFEKGTLTERQEMPPGNVLVVDDEAISRRAITYALERAKLKSVNVEDPQVAYNLLSENYFDLIFLDVDMPGMTGFELCAKLRSLPAHRNTPVVFVTSLNDFDSRTSSTISGGNDLIAKPFLFIELAIKALVYVLRGRLEAAKA